MDLAFDVTVEAQPTEVTCGPTCVAGIYRHLGSPVPLNKLIKDIPQFRGGGTLGVHLGRDALSRGYEATVYSHNLMVFDPSWFVLESEEMVKKLKKQLCTRKPRKTLLATKAYIEFLEMGGSIRWAPLSGKFLYERLEESGPLIAGLSATYLYWSMREYGPKCVVDDVKGEPQGHFVVVSGISLSKRKVLVNDPHEHNPIGGGLRYEVDLDGFINSILIGVITYDANIMQISRNQSAQNQAQNQPTRK